VGNDPKKARGLAAISEDERNRLVSEIVRYLLFSESTKTLTTRTEISKAVLSQQKVGNLLGPLLPMATEKLKQVLGWDVVTVPSFTAKGKFDEPGKTHMMLRMSPELQDFMAPVRNELPAQPNQAFLMIVLSIILMHNFAIDEDVMLANLEKFGLEREAACPLFGDLKPIDLLKDLAKYNYISIKKSNESGNATHQIHIGARSLLEIGKVNILRFINSVCKTSIDASALREFTTEQNDFLPQYATGEQPLEGDKRGGQQQQGAAAQEELGVVEPPVANGVPNGVPNGHGNRNHEEGGARRGAKAVGRRAKAAAAEQEEEDIEVPAAPQMRRRPSRRN